MNECHARYSVVGKELTDKDRDEYTDDIIRDFFTAGYQVVEIEAPVWVEHQIFEDGFVIPSHWSVCAVGK